jgi:hypothetical protein
MVALAKPRRRLPMLDIRMLGLTLCMAVFTVACSAEVGEDEPSGSSSQHLSGHGKGDPGKPSRPGEKDPAAGDRPGDGKVPPIGERPGEPRPPIQDKEPPKPPIDERPGEPRPPLPAPKPEPGVDTRPPPPADEIPKKP